MQNLFQKHINQSNNYNSLKQKGIFFMNTNHSWGMIFSIILLLLVIFILFYQNKKIKNRKKRQNQKRPKNQNNSYFDYSYMPYQRNNLLTKTEYKFYLVLKSKCDKQNLLICPKVRLEDFILVPLDDFKEKQKYRGHIKSRHVDFLITDNKLHILAGIELDDPTHDTEQAKIIDEFKDNLFETIGIPLFRIKTTTQYVKHIDFILQNIK